MPFEDCQIYFIQRVGGNAEFAHVKDSWVVLLKLLLLHIKQNLVFSYSKEICINLTIS